MIVHAWKCCKSCGTSKPPSDFYRNANGRFGLHSLCKPCLNRRTTESKSRFKSAGPARVPNHKRCPMCCRTLLESAFSRYQSAGDGLRTYCKDCDRVVRRSCKYGLSRDRVLEMLGQSNCEACRKPLACSGAKHIDHRHADGAVRGVLCDRCNTTLGRCQEDPAILMGLCRYIARTMSVDYRKQPYLEQSLPSMDSSTADPLTPEGTATRCPTNTTLPPTSQQP